MLRLVGKKRGKGFYESLLVASAVWPVVALAMTYPPYDIYTGTTSGNPQLTYTKMCEPGRTGSGNASYVILGSYDPASPAVAASYDGDVVIPAYIDGLPVRKINEAAFIACTKLRGVKIPATVREVGARAFSDCWQLTNVTFEAGVTTIGDSAFTNCASLVSITFPEKTNRCMPRRKITLADATLEPWWESEPPQQPITK